MSRVATSSPKARSLENDERARDIPIIVVTVHTFDHDRERSLAAACAVHLEKPATPMDVLTVVNRLWYEHRVTAPRAR